MNAKSVALCVAAIGAFALELRRRRRERAGIVTSLQGLGNVQLQQTAEQTHSKIVEAIKSSFPFFSASLPKSPPGIRREGDTVLIVWDEDLSTPRVVSGKFVHALPALEDLVGIGSLLGVVCLGASEAEHGFRVPQITQCMPVR